MWEKDKSQTHQVQILSDLSFYLLLSFLTSSTYLLGLPYMLNEAKFEFVQVILTVPGTEHMHLVNINFINQNGNCPFTKTSGSPVDIGVEYKGERGQRGLEGP